MQPSVPASQESPDGMIRLESEGDTPGVNFESDIDFATYGETDVAIDSISTAMAFFPVRFRYQIDD